MFVQSIVWIVIIGFAIFGVLSLFLRSSERKEDTAILILKERYARGEISEEEFKERRDFLTTQN
ncbi:SHOCT domain-containing protein [Fodinisporobacter ferrooxydans]|uniref:SHOCT domain-containing protein n=1 Tax=Fodinisporobacter ferrooxydans TaxID=2901836 RepID=A0ABY4CSU5_9BACL|nr:SHOCT domain-containing protein [Alicyclobacillaceae bacterium MYW30-H2]